MQELERNYAPLNPQQNPLGCTRQETRKGEAALGTTLPVQTTLKTQDKRQTVHWIADTTKHQLRRLKKKRLSIIYTETFYGNFYGNMASKVYVNLIRSMYEGFWPGHLQRTTFRYTPHPIWSTPGSLLSLLFFIIAIDWTMRRTTAHKKNSEVESHGGCVILPRSQWGGEPWWMHNAPNGPRR